jgi:hypothetical protein
MPSADRREVHHIVESLAEDAASGDPLSFLHRMARLREIHADAVDWVAELHQTLATLRPFEERFLATRRSAEGKPDFVLKTVDRSGEKPRERILAVIEAKPDTAWSPLKVWQTLQATGYVGSLESVQVNMRRMANDGVIAKPARGVYGAARRKEVVRT